MKKIVLTLIVAAMWLLGSAQTLNVEVGDVTYLFPSSQAGIMPYSTATTLTVMDKVFALGDITRMYVDNTVVTDDLVEVVYSDNSAKVRIAGNIAKYMTPSVSGANVSVVQDATAVAQEITYSLSGSSSNGSFYTSGAYKITVSLNDLSLTSATGAPLNIDNGKRIAVVVNGTNSFVDSSSGSQKACVVIKGHSEFTGNGTLNVTGNLKHAIRGNEYVELKKKFTGTINILDAVSDGIHIEQYFKMSNGTVNVLKCGDDGIQVEITKDVTDELNGQVLLLGGTLNINVSANDIKGLKCDSLMTISDDIGNNTTINITCSASATAAKGLKSGGNMNITGGTITISTAGDGIEETETSTSGTLSVIGTSAASCIKSDGILTISGGTFNLTSTGAGGKGISCDSIVNINGGDITISTSGKPVVYANSRLYNGTYSGNLDYIDSDFKSSAKGIKADYDVNINGGVINVTTTGTNAEGIESKAELKINDGTVTVNSYDDGINAKSHIRINGGTVTVVATNNDGIDSNGNFYLNGGYVMSFGARQPECGIDANEESGYTVVFNGGTLLAVGGSNSVPSNSSGSKQPYVQGSGTVSANTTISLTARNSSTVLASFTVPSNYSTSSGGGGFGPGGGGFGGNGSKILITCAGLTSGSSYTIKSGSSSINATAALTGNSGGPGGGW